MKTQSTEETFRQACKLRPALKPFLETFAPLFSQRQAVANRLAPKIAQLDLSLISNAGSMPLLLHNLPEGLATFIREAAEEIMPGLMAISSISPYREQLARLFLVNGSEQDLEALLKIRLSDDRDDLLALAKKYELQPEILVFASDFIISAVLRALALCLPQSNYPDWRKKECPVCGSLPVIAWLARRPPVENNEFLASGGGKKHLHCGACGCDWHFVRGICPSCGTNGQDAMQILGEENRRHERIDWCKKCNTYLPLIDLREIGDTPDMDAMALCLMHLDLAAAEKDLIPLKPSFWNMF